MSATKEVLIMRAFCYGKMSLRQKTRWRAARVAPAIYAMQRSADMRYAQVRALVHAVRGDARRDVTAFDGDAALLPSEATLPQRGDARRDGRRAR